MKIYSGWQFSVFRIIFGTYLSIHFAFLIPYASEIWGSKGMLPNPELNFTYGLFPNLLASFNSPSFITLFLIALFILALFITTGVFRRTSSLITWYGWACLFHQNNLISNPGIPMVGWLLLALVLVPAGEDFCLFGKRNESWELPASLYWGAWLIVGVAYTVSGFDKLMAPSWQNGTAIEHLLHNPLARDWFFRDMLLHAPSIVTKLMTWFALILEIVFGFLCLFKKTRLLAWLGIMGMHLSILSMVNFPDLTIGVMMIHIFTIDPSWFQKYSDSKKIVFFDGVCGFCNGWINFLIDVDKNKNLRYAALQSETAKMTLPDTYISNLNSIIFLDGQKMYSKSTAVLRIFLTLGGMWSMIGMFIVFPGIVRDFIYDLIARYRYNIFGKLDACRMPNDQTKKLFLS